MHDDTVKINYHRHEFKIPYHYTKSDGPVVVYLHGLGCSKMDFEGALDCRELKNSSLLAFDFPGSWGSEYPDDLHLSVDDLVNITDLLISSLRINEAVLVGHSMGGLVGLMFAEHFSKRIRGFINVEGNLTSQDCFLSRKAIGVSFETFEQQVWPKILSSVKADPSAGSQAYLKNLAKVNRRAYYDLCASLVSYSDKGDLIERFLKLSMPKVYIYGEENRKLAYLPTLKSQINVVEIPKSGHAPGYDNPTFYYKAIAAFLDSIPSMTS